jgi:hypothetical protein
VGWVARAQGQGRAQSGRLGRGWGVGTDSEEGAADDDGGVMATAVAGELSISQGSSSSFLAANDVVFLTCRIVHCFPLMI